MEISITYKGELIKNYSSEGIKLATIGLAFMDLDLLKLGVVKPKHPIFTIYLLGYNVGYVTLFFTTYLVLLMGLRRFDDYRICKKIGIERKKFKNRFFCVMILLLFELLVELFIP